MENAYQDYMGQVNFVWIYGPEAHPEEYPFQEGYETADLGWEHPYGITTEMAERAQRGKWLKTDPDPDLTLPMLIDYINDPPNTDNAMKSAYTGGGFYSGYIIDCDGTILVREAWAWADTENQWWGLPLADIDGLYSFLDDYLESPPECYVEGDADADTDTDTDTDTDVDGDSDGDDDGGGDESCGCATVGNEKSSPSLLSVVSTALF